MRLTLLVAAALCGMSITAAAAQKKTTLWFSYLPGSQTCDPKSGGPAEAIAYVLWRYHQQPDVEDITDDNGKVVSTIISWPYLDGRGEKSIVLFRTAEACEDYARTQRPDLHKYD